MFITLFREIKVERTAVDTSKDKAVEPDDIKAENVQEVVSDDRSDEGEYHHPFLCPV